MAGDRSIPSIGSAVDVEAMFRLDGKVALVTGASSGLGERFARVLTDAGARVILVARRLDRLERLANELDGAVPVGCDLNRSADLELPVRRAIDEYGRIDIVVNNAGMESSAPAIDEDEQRFRDVLSVNLVAPFVLAATPPVTCSPGVRAGRSSTSRRYSVWAG